MYRIIYDICLGTAGKAKNFNRRNFAFVVAGGIRNSTFTFLEFALCSCTECTNCFDDFKFSNENRIIMQHTVLAQNRRYRCIETDIGVPITAYGYSIRKLLFFFFFFTCDFSFHTSRCINYEFMISLKIHLDGSDYRFGN